MREIKFRWWLPEYKQMYYPKFIENGISYMINAADGQLAVADNKYRGSNYTISAHSNLMQFTGLTDKNGKEIYEGDIVLAFNQKPFVEAIKKKCVFKNASFVFEQHHLDSATRTLASSDCEVIGNIYENPTLLI